MQVKRTPGSLSPRLESIISLIRNGAVISDIGCDHAYISVEAIKRKKAVFAVAGDIKPGPLKRAEKSILDYCFGADIIKDEHFACVLGDGLEKAASYKPNDVIIAGMGGELISKIINDSPYSKTPGVNFILQPMTSSYELRRYLSENGFSILRETREREDGKYYEIILTTYIASPYKMSEAELTIGRKSDFSDEEIYKYIEFANYKIEKLEKIINKKRTGGADFSAEKSLCGEIISLIS